MVFNKADLIAPAEGRRLLLGHPDAVVRSATDRETTRELLAKLAERLKSRWEEAAMVPTYEVEAAEGEPGDGGLFEGEAESMTVLGPPSSSRGGESSSRVRGTFEA